VCPSDNLLRIGQRAFRLVIVWNSAHTNPETSETKLSAAEFLERRLSDELFSLAMLRFMISGCNPASETHLPDALQ